MQIVWAGIRNDDDEDNNKHTQTRDQHWTTSQKWESNQRPRKASPIPKKIKTTNQQAAQN